MKQVAASVFSVKMEVLADELLNATTDEERAVAIAKVNTLKEYEELLTSDAPARTARKQAPKKLGRTTYSVERVMRLPQGSCAVTFNYSQFVESGDRPEPQRVEGVLLGFLAVGNHKETTLAIQAAHDVLDLKRGEIYGFQAKSLRDLIISE